jgi:hypothetical protein
MEHFIGHRQSPSLSEAMSNPFYPHNNSISSTSLTPSSTQYPIQYSQQYSCAQVASKSPYFEESFEKKSNLEEIERKLCERIDRRLNFHCKQVKSKLNRLKSRVDANDLFLDRVEKIIDSISNYLTEKKFHHKLIVPSHNFGLISDYLKNLFRIK